MKRNLDFFEHKVDSPSHWKFKMLRSLFEKEFNINGWAGEGMFWALNCEIAKSDDCLLDISEEIKKLSIAADLGISGEEFDRFLTILTDKVKLLKRDKNGRIFNDKTQALIDDLLQYREYYREKKRESRGLKKKEYASRKTSQNQPELQLDNQNVQLDNQNVHREKGPVPPISKVKKVYNSFSNEKDANEVCAPDEKIDGIVGVINPEKNPVQNLVKKSGGKKKIPAKKNSGPNEELFNRIKNSWMVWFAARNKNQKPNFGAKEAGATSKLRAYFLKNANDQNSEDPFCDAAKEFEKILDDWEKLKESAFLYSCVDICMMNSKINDITNFLNNGTTAQGRYSTNKNDIGKSIKFDKL